MLYSQKAFIYTIVISISMLVFNFTTISFDVQLIL
jgi:hypothetical protein